ncbi:hypothetical protein EG329_013597 [Mollisiaceae sp. DMI_Dod_QoI]|nr:hypothetical protein EG329_013597 [Helotiales sp. DMI_Dod_QoI]
MVDPIMAWGMAPGYCIDPFVSIVQHSCTGNTSLIFEGNELRIRALRSIAKDEEILIPWLEFSKDVSTRAKRLLADWNLTCNCEACLKGTEDTNMRLRQLKVTCLRLVVKPAKEIELAFGADSVASRVQQRWMAEVMHHFNIPGNYDRYVVDKKSIRKYADMSRDIEEQDLFVRDMNELLEWAGTPAQTFDELMG